jgi:plastocyanin
MKRLLSFSASVALLAACGGGGGTSAPAETLPAGALVVTAVSGLRFDAETYGPVTAGDIVFGYQNEDSIRHTLIIAKDDTKVPNFKLVIAKKGDVDSGSVTLDAGTYTLICDVPGHGNMRASLTVE